MTAASTRRRGEGGAEAQFIEPVMVRIPEQWCCMGGEAGRDDRKPAHRGWVDSFALAAYQVTKAEYRHFLDGTSASPPPCWTDSRRGSACPIKKVSILGIRYFLDGTSAS